MTTSSRINLVRRHFTAAGTLAGALLGFVVGLVGGSDPVFAALVVLAYGALFGAILGGLADDWR